MAGSGDASTGLRITTHLDHAYGRDVAHFVVALALASATPVRAAYINSQYTLLTRITSHHGHPSRVPTTHPHSHTTVVWRTNLSTLTTQIYWPG